MELVIQKVSRKGKQSPQRKHLRVKPHPLPLSLSRNSECSGGREGAVLQNNTKLYTYHISYRIYPNTASSSYPSPRGEGRCCSVIPNYIISHIIYKTYLNLTFSIYTPFFIHNLPLSPFYQPVMNLGTPLRRAERGWE